MPDAEPAAEAAAPEGAGGGQKKETLADKARAAEQEKARQLLEREMEGWRFVKLVSCDGHEFFVDEHIARSCEVIGKMLDLQISAEKRAEAGKILAGRAKEAAAGGGGSKEVPGDKEEDEEPQPPYRTITFGDGSGAEGDGAAAGGKGGDASHGGGGLSPEPIITGRLLEKVIEYLYYRHKYTDSPVFIPEFPLDEAVVLDLLPVANYLGLNK